MNIRIWSVLSALVLVGRLTTAQPLTYCFEGAAYTCFQFAVTTQTTTEGTEVTVSLSNLEGVPTPDGTPHVAWARIYAIHLLSNDATFDGGPVLDTIPAVSLTGVAEAVGDIRDRWFVSDLEDAEATSTYRGYSLGTPVADYGADIVGCTLPPDEGYPYFRTCLTEGEGAVSFTFNTEGTWDAAEAAIVVAVDDPYAQANSSGEPMTCLVAGNLPDAPDAYRCASASTIPLPIELTAFSATADGPDVLLRWETASEADNAGFTVEHAPKNATWVPIGWVKGFGTTADPQHYLHRVEGLAPGTHRFRLKQTDYDGTFDYGPEVEVSIAMTERFMLAPPYPNPFNPRTTLRFAVVMTAPVRLVLYNALGQEVRVLFEGVAAAGETQTVHLDGSGLPSGVYLVRLTGEKVAATEQLVLMK